MDGGIVQAVPLNYCLFVLSFLCFDARHKLHTHGYWENYLGSKAAATSRYAGTSYWEGDDGGRELSYWEGDDGG